MNGFENLLTQNIAALAMAAAFLWYLSKKDKELHRSLDEFNKTVQNHLSHALKVEVGLTKALQKLSDCIVNLKRK